MTSLDLFVEGKRVRLGERIGKGGEGEVYKLADNTALALKVYTVTDTAEREAKIAAMVRGQFAGRSKLIAFPLAVARRTDGRFAGFTMRLIGGHKPVHELYAPGVRKQHFPAADYRFLVRAAGNIARAVAAVHASGCVIGDINHSGVLISDTAIAALIDADSFQLVDGAQRFLCRVGVPEYTPPELQGVKLGGIERNPNHDAFGLAIVIFQLLTMGRHPFVGAYQHGEMPIGRAIAEYRFAYTGRAAVGMKPPQGACELSDFIPEVSSAFEDAFGRATAPDRPSAARWVELLQQLERSLKRCPTVDHHYFSAAAPECPWCRMEGRLGIVLFLPPAIITARNLSDPGIDAFDLKLTWAAIEAVALPDAASLQPKLSSCSPPLSTAAASFLRQRRRQQAFGIVCLVAAALLVAAAPKLLPLAITLAGCGGWMKFVKSGLGADELRGRYRKAEENWHAALSDWRARCGLDAVYELKMTLEQARSDLEALVDVEREQLLLCQHDSRAAQLQMFLSRFPIRTAAIKGIGPAKLLALASYGIDTAADVTWVRVLDVPGFGPINSKPLLAWRQGLEGNFRYSPAFAQEQVKRLQDEFAAKAAALRTQLASGAADLRAAAATVATRSSVSDPVLERINFERCQARKDLEALGADIPVVSFPPPPPQRQPVRPLSSPGQNAQRAGPQRPKLSTIPQSSKQTSCPRCGSRMVRRIARRGRNAGSAFWGCSKYPSCRGTRTI